MISEFEVSDRRVRQLVPQPESQDSEQTLTFSAFANRPNVVLLGDPGAGKTHLFRSSAEATGGLFLRVRDFLNIPAVPAGATLFIDALDEKRSGRGDDDVVDHIVRKLFENSSARVRISCRERDWLGESDLAAFKPYFDQHGGAVVLGLQPLSMEEQTTVLVAHGVLDTTSFINEVIQRGLEEFLTNPQNLIMLAEVVRSGDWPATRKELFEMATRILLSEPNKEHARMGIGAYGPEELRDAAGAICAARLISDIDGISVSDQDNNPEYPSYRSITFFNAERVRAALARRIFSASSAGHSVDYGHRTTAEYLAAGWLAKTIRAGLPVGRVRALLGVDGQPSAELRGLHAWLPVFLPEAADQFIEADPYGVLTYGDAGSLSLSSRNQLLDALSRLSRVDPWFRSGNWSSTRLGGLSGSDMVGSFRTILNSPGSNFALRSVVVDAVAAGKPLPELQDDLAAVLVRLDAPYAERRGAFIALLRIGQPGKEAVVHACRERLGSEAASVRLRAEIISELYGESFGPSDVATLLDSALNPIGQLPGGSLLSLRMRIPLADIPEILSNFQPRRQSAGPLDRQNVHEVAYVFDGFLLRLLQDAERVAADSLWRWLRSRRALHDSYTRGSSDEIRDALRTRPDLLRAVVSQAIVELTVDEKRWGFIHDLREATLYAIDEDDLLEQIAAHRLQAQRGSDIELFLYEIALALCFRSSPRAIAIFEHLYALGDDRSDLMDIRNGRTVVTIPDWQIEQNQQLANDKVTQHERLAQIRREFARDEESIRRGANFEWLTWLADIYFGNFPDLDPSATPYDRLVSVLEETKASIAIEGFVAALQRPDIPSLQEIAEAAAEHRLCRWWYAIVAGLDEFWLRSPRLDNWCDSLLTAALAFDLTNPTFEQSDRVTQRRDHGWKAAALESRPELAREAYLAVAEALLARREDQATGLYELLNEPALAGFKSETTFRLLNAFPDAAPPLLQQLLESAYDITEGWGQLLALARSVLQNLDAISEIDRDKWLVAAFLLSPQEFQNELATRADVDVEIVWTLREMIGHRSGESRQPPALTIAQIEFMAGIAAPHFPHASPPSGSFWGDRNPWDGSEFVGAIINRISGDPSEVATEALLRLEADSRLVTYRDFLRHALATQLARRREFEYRQPDWRQTVAALSNGAPANVADLHALLVDHLRENAIRIGSANNDVYKRFWNEDSYGRVRDPKPEESCRDVLIDFLRPRLQPLGVSVEPEGHMAADRRADISVSLPGQKIPVELKRDYHRDVWHAAETQLDRFYTHDPDASGFGVYGVFWFGKKRRKTIPAPPGGQPCPQSADDMGKMLTALVPNDKRSRIVVVVIDVSGRVN